jgi:predicted ATPase
VPSTSLIDMPMAGVFWVGLGPLRDPTLVTATITQTLGAKEDVAGHIGERELLLLLDNLEQVVEAAPELTALVEACPNLKLLVTSRELLRVRGEVEYPELPLAEAEAVELFCARARAEPDESVHQLCRALDNLPLALELAAARASVLSPKQILERLSKRLDLLRGGRDADPRQRTLRAAIEWSYELLSEEERVLFARLSVFAGGCTLEAAEEVADADLNTLQSLVEKSLLRHTEARFWMLETIREYAAERLRESGEGDEVRERHAARFLQLAEGRAAEIGEPSLTLFAAEQPNLRVALAWLAEHDDGERRLRLASALGRFWFGGGSGAEGLVQLESALACSPAAPAELRARALFEAARIAMRTSDCERSRADPADAGSPTAA